MTRTRRALVAATTSIAALVVGMVSVPATSALPPGAAASTTATSVASPATGETNDSAADTAAAAGDDANQTMQGGAVTKMGDGDQYPAKLANGKFNTVGGNMFDACAAPALETMRAWLASPYRAVGIYIGGVSRSCAQPNLTPSWIKSTSAMGWSHVPIYVGLQASCATYGSPARYFPHRMSTNESTAAAQGREAALDAIAKMRAVGIDASVPIYLDMEAYNTTNGPCAVGVRAFTNAWTATLHSKGYLSGLYGSAASMIRHAQLWTAQGNYARPDKLWFARWNGVADAEEPFLPANEWVGHRIKQFAGGKDCVNCTQTWGGVTLRIDANYIQSFSTPPSVFASLRSATIWDSKTVSVGTKPVRLAVAGLAGVPRDATAALLSIEIAHPTAAGELIVEPRGGTGTALSSQVFAKGQQVSATVVVPLSVGAIQFRTTAGKARVIVKANGYLTNPLADSSDGIAAVTPRILWDSKKASIGTAPVGLALRGVGPIPADATSAILSVQVVGPTAAGSLFVEPHGAGSSASVQQFAPGRSTTATVTVPLSDTTRAAQFRVSAGKARIVVSVLGYTSPGAAGRLTVTAPARLWDSVRPTVTTRATGLAVAGRNEIPAAATAVLMTVQVVNPSANADLLIEPRDSRTSTRILSLTRGQSATTTVLVPVAKRAVQMRLSSGNARVIVNTVGYVTDYVAPPTEGDLDGISEY